MPGIGDGISNECLDSHLLKSYVSTNDEISNIMFQQISKSFKCNLNDILCIAIIRQYAYRPIL